MSRAPLLPPLPPAIPWTAYPRWRSWAHALLDGARLMGDDVRMRRRPRPAVRIGAIVHTEAVVDPAVFPAFVELCRFFEDVTGTRMLACIIPGSNPLVRGLMAAHGLGPAALAERIRILARHSVVGYHGHYFHPPSGAGAPEPMCHAAFDETTFHEQLDADLEWFATLGISPGFYTGGWWVLNRTIVEALDSAGVRYDFTLRPVLRNTFGEGYDLPVPTVDGSPFSLGRGLWELGSFAGLWRYPADTSAWRAASEAGGQPRFFGLYFHDYDVLNYAAALRRMIARLSRVPWLGWVAFDDLSVAGLP